MTLDDFVVSVQNERLCCSLLVLHEVQGTVLRLELFRTEMLFAVLGASQVKLMFIKTCDFFSGKFCSKMYEPLLFYGNREMLCDSQAPLPDHIYLSLWSFFEFFALFLIYL